MKTITSIALSISLVLVSAGLSPYEALARGIGGTRLAGPKAAVTVPGFHSDTAFARPQLDSASSWSGAPATFQPAALAEQAELGAFDAVGRAPVSVLNRAESDRSSMVESARALVSTAEQLLKAPSQQGSASLGSEAALPLLSQVFDGNALLARGPSVAGRLSAPSLSAQMGAASTGRAVRDLAVNRVASPRKAGTPEFASAPAEGKALLSNRYEPILKTGIYLGYAVGVVASLSFFQATGGFSMLALPASVVFGTLAGDRVGRGTVKDTAKRYSDYFASVGGVQAVSVKGNEILLHVASEQAVRNSAAKFATAVDGYSVVLTAAPAPKDAIVPEFKANAVFGSQFWSPSNKLMPGQLRDYAVVILASLGVAYLFDPILGMISAGAGIVFASFLARFRAQSLVESTPSNPTAFRQIWRVLKALFFAGIALYAGMNVGEVAYSFVGRAYPPFGALATLVALGAAVFFSRRSAVNAGSLSINTGLFLGMASFALLAELAMDIFGNPIAGFGFSLPMALILGIMSSGAFQKKTLND